jgi:hypothetical protein
LYILEKAGGRERRGAAHRHTTTTAERRGAELNKSAEKKCKKAKECEIDMAAVVSFPLFSDW